MTQPDRRERIGTALSAMAADLVAERQRVRALERENRDLRRQVEGLLTEPDMRRAPVLRAGYPAQGREVAHCPHCGRPLAQSLNGGGASR